MLKPIKYTPNSTSTSAFENFHENTVSSSTSLMETSSDSTTSLSSRSDQTEDTTEESQREEQNAGNLFLSSYDSTKQLRRIDYRGVDIASDSALDLSNTDVGSTSSSSFETESDSDTQTSSDTEVEMNVEERKSSLVSINPWSERPNTTTTSDIDTSQRIQHCLATSEIPLYQTEIPDGCEIQGILRDEVLNPTKVLRPGESYDASFKFALNKLGSSIICFKVKFREVGSSDHCKWAFYYSSFGFEVAPLLECRPVLFHGPNVSLLSNELVNISPFQLQLGPSSFQLEYPEALFDDYVLEQERLHHLYKLLSEEKTQISKTIYQTKSGNKVISDSVSKSSSTTSPVIKPKTSLSQKLWFLTASSTACEPSSQSENPSNASIPSSKSPYLSDKLSHEVKGRNSVSNSGKRGGKVKETALESVERVSTPTPATTSMLLNTSTSTNCPSLHFNLNDLSLARSQLHKVPVRKAFISSASQSCPVQLFHTISFPTDDLKYGPESRFEHSNKKKQENTANEAKTPCESTYQTPSVFQRALRARYGFSQEKIQGIESNILAARKDKAIMSVPQEASSMLNVSPSKAAPGECKRTNDSSPDKIYIDSLEERQRYSNLHAHIKPTLAESPRVSLVSIPGHEASSSLANKSAPCVPRKHTHAKSFSDSVETSALPFDSAVCIEGKKGNEKDTMRCRSMSTESITSESLLNTRSTSTSASASTSTSTSIPTPFQMGSRLSLASVGSTASSVDSPQTLLLQLARGKAEEKDVDVEDRIVFKAKENGRDDDWNIKQNPNIAENTQETQTLAESKEQSDMLENCDSEYIDDNGSPFPLSTSITRNSLEAMIVTPSRSRNDVYPFLSHEREKEREFHIALDSRLSMNLGFELDSNLSQESFENVEVDFGFELSLTPDDGSELNTLVDVNGQTEYENRSKNLLDSTSTLVFEEIEKNISQKLKTKRRQNNEKHENPSVLDDKTPWNFSNDLENSMCSIGSINGLERGEIIGTTHDTEKSHDELVDTFESSQREKNDLVEDLHGSYEVFSRDFKHQQAYEKMAKTPVTSTATSIEALVTTRTTTTTTTTTTATISVPFSTSIPVTSTPPMYSPTEHYEGSETPTCIGINLPNTPLTQFPVTVDYLEKAFSTTLVPGQGTLRQVTIKPRLFSSPEAFEEIFTSDADHSDSGIPPAKTSASNFASSSSFLTSRSISTTTTSTFASASISVHVPYVPSVLREESSSNQAESRFRQGRISRNLQYENEIYIPSSLKNSEKTHEQRGVGLATDISIPKTTETYNSAVSSTSATKPVTMVAILDTSRSPAPFLATTYCYKTGSLTSEQVCIEKSLREELETYSGHMDVPETLDMHPLITPWETNLPTDSLAESLATGAQSTSISSMAVCEGILSTMGGVLGSIDVKWTALGGLLRGRTTISVGITQPSQTRYIAAPVFDVLAVEMAREYLKSQFEHIHDNSDIRNIHARENGEENAEIDKSEKGYDKNNEKNVDEEKKKEKETGTYDRGKVNEAQVTFRKHIFELYGMLNPHQLSSLIDSSNPQHCKVLSHSPQKYKNHLTVKYPPSSWDSFAVKYEGNLESFPPEDRPQNTLFSLASLNTHSQRQEEYGSLVSQVHHSYFGILSAPTSFPPKRIWLVPGPTSSKSSLKISPKFFAPNPSYSVSLYSSTQACDETIKKPEILTSNFRHIPSAVLSVIRQLVHTSGEKIFPRPCKEECGAYVSASQYELFGRLHRTPSIPAQVAIQFLSSQIALRERYAASHWIELLDRLRQGPILLDKRHIFRRNTQVVKEKKNTRATLTSSAIAAAIEAVSGISVFLVRAVVCSINTKADKNTNDKTDSESSCISPKDQKHILNIDQRKSLECRTRMKDITSESDRINNTFFTQQLRPYTSIQFTFAICRETTTTKRHVEEKRESTRSLLPSSFSFSLFAGSCQKCTRVVEYPEEICELPIESTFLSGLTEQPSSSRLKNIECIYSNAHLSRQEEAAIYGGSFYLPDLQRVLSSPSSSFQKEENARERQEDKQEVEEKEIEEVGEETERNEEYETSTGLITNPAGKLALKTSLPTLPTILFDSNSLSSTHQKKREDSKVKAQMRGQETKDNSFAVSTPIFPPSQPIITEEMKKEKTRLKLTQKQERRESVGKKQPEPPSYPKPPKKSSESSSEPSSDSESTDLSNREVVPMLSNEMTDLVGMETVCRCILPSQPTFAGTSSNQSQGLTETHTNIGGHILKPPIALALTGAVSCRGTLTIQEEMSNKPHMQEASPQNDVHSSAPFYFSVNAHTMSQGLAQLPNIWMHPMKSSDIADGGSYNYIDEITAKRQVDVIEILSPSKAQEETLRDVSKAEKQHQKIFHHCIFSLPNDLDKVVIL